MGSSDRAQALERMLAARPEDSRLRFGLALEYLASGRTDDGVRELQLYLDAADDEGNGWGRLGAALLELGREEEAQGKRSQDCCPCLLKATGKTTNTKTKEAFFRPRRRQSPTIVSS